MINFEDAIYDKMAEIVFHEHRPFWFRDFAEIEVDGRKEYPAYGTIRNVFWKLRKQGKIIFCFNSGGIAFHTFPNTPYSKKTTMISPHTRARKADWIFES